MLGRSPLPVSIEPPLPEPRPASDGVRTLSLLLGALMACAAPVLLAYSAPPSATFLNQLLAFGGWGLFTWLIATTDLPVHRMALAVSHCGPPPGSPWGAGWPAAGALGLLMFGLGWSCMAGTLPDSLAMSSAGMLAAAGGVLFTGVWVAQRGRMNELMAACAWALVFAGLLSALAGMVQVFAPAWTHPHWLPATGLPGRAAGSLRQPNHLSTLLLWSMVALAWCAQGRRLNLAAVGGLGGVMVLGIVLSASRTGLLGVLLLACWGAVDRQLRRPVRLGLMAAPVAYALWWWLVEHGGSLLPQGFAGSQRFSTQGDVSSSRFAIWSDTLSLLWQHPWGRVGFGEFNFAWSLTPFPARPVAFFDHTHNLPLQLLVELGWPLGLGVLILASLALWRAWRAADLGAPEEAASSRAAFMLVLVVSVHSLLEYPLWYSYFLLPTVFALGLCLGASRRVVPGSGEPEAAAERPRGAITVQAMGAVMVVASLYALADYWKVVVIFAPGTSTASLDERIEAGKRSTFFAHHAHYAAATTAAHPAEAMSSFKQASHFLLDTRLMLAWARAYAEAGDLERARHLADRLREFRNPGSQTFFAECDQAPPAGAAPPFQCVPASRAMDFRDFR